jgi:acetyl-CoA C-acetyltransferase
LSVLVARSMFDTDGAQIRPDLAIWGTVAPNLGYSNIAREILIDADLGQTIPAFSTGY